MKRTSIALFVASLGLFLLSLANLSPGPSAAPEPKTVEVTGTVSVDNFPVQPEVPGVVSFIGFTSDLPQAVKNLTASRACDTAFPGSRICSYEEVVLSIPPTAYLPTARGRDSHLQGFDFTRH